MKGKLHSALFILLLLLGFVVRLYRFDNPIADWHSWRQADTSAVSWHFAYQGFDILHPLYFDISNVQSKKDNPHGYRFVEFPLYNIAQAGLFKTFGILTLEQWGRLVTISMSLLGSVFLFLIVKDRLGKIAYFVLLFSLFLPYNIYYGRTILPDTSMIAMLLGGIYFFGKWLRGFDNKKPSFKMHFYILSLLLCATSLLLKPYGMFYSFVFLAMLWETFGWQFLKKWEIYFFALLSIIPLGLWRIYMLQYPEGIPVSNWLFNGNGIRFHPAFFRWIFYERLTKLISGYSGVIFLIFGLKYLFENKKNTVFFLSFVLSALTYLFIIATGNVQQDYYQIVIMPAVAILMGCGVYALVLFLKKYMHTNLSYVTVLVLICLSLFFSWQQVKDYFNINNIEVVHAGEAVDHLTPKDAKIIAPLGGDTTMLYYAKRKGWPSFEHSLEELKQLGASYMVLVNPTQQDYALGKQYVAIVATKEYILFDLKKKL